MDFLNMLNPVAKWLHIIAGVMWIGLLYFFNFINGHVAATMDGDTKKKVVPELMPRALYWFRWGAAWTWFTGIILLYLIFWKGNLSMGVSSGNTMFDYGAEVNMWTHIMLLVTFVAVFLYDFLYKSALAKNLAILRSRVDELGVSQPVIQQQGKDRIIVQLPGLQDSTRAKTILGSTATLEFRLTKGVPVDWLESKKKGKSILNNALLYEQRIGGPILLSRQIIVGGKDIKGANSGFDSVTNSPAVFVNLSDYGASRMLTTTSKNVGNRMAVIFVEKNKNEVINVSTIRESFGQRFQITGLDLEEAKDLAILLRSGSLSAPMSIVEERTVGPTLGQYNIISGKQSMYLGLLLVCLFMFLYYRFFGFVSILALIVNILLIIAVLSLFQATLTLPGIAGIVLTVGMAVDANVLIYERIREELLNGNSPNASIYTGYKKAFSTISDANLTTLIAAIALLTIGTGAVKGFAVTLVIGILSSMFTAIVGTRAVVSIVYENKKNNQLSI